MQKLSAFQYELHLSSLVHVTIEFKGTSKTQRMEEVVGEKGNREETEGERGEAQWDVDGEDDSVMWTKV